MAYRNTCSHLIDWLIGKMGIGTELRENNLINAGTLDVYNTDMFDPDGGVGEVIDEAIDTFTFEELTKTSLTVCSGLSAHTAGVMVLNANMFKADQVQDFLDSNRRYINGEMLEKSDDRLHYFTGFDNLENTCELRSSTASTGYSTYTPDTSYLLSGEFVFTSDPNDMNIYLYGHTYNLNMVLAEMYECVANDESKFKSYRRGNVSISQRDLLEKAEYFRAIGQPVTVMEVNKKYSGSSGGKTCQFCGRRV